MGLVRSLISENFLDCRSTTDKWPNSIHAILVKQPDRRSGSIMAFVCVVNDGIYPRSNQVDGFAAPTRFEIVLKGRGILDLNWRA
jgi:hypothetical protein